MGSPDTDYAAAMEAMRTSVRCNTYHNPMAVSQVLPALHLKSYLNVKNKQCLFEAGTWMSCSAPLWPDLVTPVCRYNGASFCRHSGAGNHRSSGGITKSDQSEPKGRRCDIQRGNGSLFFGCTKGQHPVGGPRNTQRQECWLHVSVVNARTLRVFFF